MRFESRNAIQAFQKFIDEVVGNLHFIHAGVDDVPIASKDEKQYLEHLKMAYAYLQKFIVIVLFLSYIMSSGAPSIEKIAIIPNFLKPKSVKQLRQFPGMLSIFTESRYPHGVDRSSAQRSVTG